MHGQVSDGHDIDDDDENDDDDCMEVDFQAMLVEWNKTTVEPFGWRYVYLLLKNAMLSLPHRLVSFPTAVLLLDLILLFQRFFHLPL